MKKNVFLNKLLLPTWAILFFNSSCIFGNCSGLEKDAIFLKHPDSTFIQKSIDVDKDGRMDLVISSAPYQGDSLFCYINRGDGFELELETVNFSMDGGHVFKDVISLSSSDMGFSVVTYFPDRGFEEKVYDILYINNDWVLSTVYYEAIDWQNSPSEVISNAYCFENLSLNDNFEQVEQAISRSAEFLSAADFKGLYINPSKLLKMVENKDFCFVKTTIGLINLLRRHPVFSENVVDYNNIGYYLEQAGMFDEAVLVLKEVVSYRPNRVVAYINLGDAYWGLEEYEKAKQAYGTYIEQMKSSGKESRIPSRVFERVE